MLLFRMPDAVERWNWQNTSCGKSLTHVTPVADVAAMGISVSRVLHAPPIHKNASYIRCIASLSAQCTGHGTKNSANPRRNGRFVLVVFAQRGVATATAAESLRRTHFERWGRAVVVLLGVGGRWWWTCAAVVSLMASLKPGENFSDDEWELSEWSIGPLAAKQRDAFPNWA